MLSIIKKGEGPAFSDGLKAWVNYQQHVKWIDGTTDSPTPSREQRVLVKQDGQWKILSQTTYLTESFGSGPKAIQEGLNSIAYLLYQDKKLDETIEVLKLNAQLNPDASNIYEHLGFTYAETGNRKLAIRNYEKSLRLNPGNENDRKGLPELRQKAQASIK